MSPLVRMSAFLQDLQTMICKTMLILAQSKGLAQSRLKEQDMQGSSSGIAGFMSFFTTMTKKYFSQNSPSSFQLNSPIPHITSHITLPLLGFM